jgi:hypothetical protein
MMEIHKIYIDYAIRIISSSGFYVSNTLVSTFTTINMGSFVGANIFVGTDEYNSNYPKPTNIVYFVSWGRAPMNIEVVRFDFDLPHIFIGGAMSPTNIWGGQG